MKINETLAGMAAAVAMAFAISLTGCGGSQPAATQQEAPAAQEQAQETAKEQAPAATEQAAPAQTEQAAPAQQQAAPAQQEAQISPDEAKAIALADAGVTEADTTGLHVDLDYDDENHTTKYEVDFHVGTTDYDYDIDPTTGAILKADSEIDD